MLIFFSKSTFSKISFRNTIRVSNYLEPDQVLSGLIWVQTVGNRGYQQTTRVGNEIRRKNLQVCLKLLIRIRSLKTNLSDIFQMIEEWMIEVTTSDKIIFSSRCRSWFILALLFTCLTLLFLSLKQKAHARIQRGIGGPDPPHLKKSQKYRVS